MQPHRQQPTRLPRPWDSPGKNSGVGCHFLLQCMKGKSESEIAQSCPTLCDPMVCSLPGSSVHGIFQARVLEWGAIAFSMKRHRNFIYICHHFYIDKENWIKSLIKLEKSYNFIKLRLFHNWLLFCVVELCLSAMDVELAWFIISDGSNLPCTVTSYWYITLLSLSPMVVTFTEAEGNPCWFFFLVSYS